MVVVDRFPIEHESWPVVLSVDVPCALPLVGPGVVDRPTFEPVPSDPPQLVVFVQPTFVVVKLPM